MITGVRLISTDPGALTALFDLVSMFALIEQVLWESAYLDDLVAGRTACEHLARLDIVDIQCISNRLGLSSPRNVTQLDSIVAKLALSACFRFSYGRSRMNSTSL